MWKRLKDLVSIILPAYNEAGVIEDSVEKVREKLLELDRDFEIIIAENGSTDGTDVISKKLSDEYEDVKYLHSNKGRGNALRAAFKKAKGDVIVYMDTDLSTDLSYIEVVVNSIYAGYDVVTGTRLLPESIVVGRTLKREIASRSYNFLVRLILGSKLMDHQCGFKAFNGESLRELIDDVKDNDWSFDTEILVKAQKKGFKVTEIPVRWVDTTDTSVRFLKDVFVMGYNILKFRWEL